MKFIITENQYNLIVLEQDRSTYLNYGNLTTPSDATQNVKYNPITKRQEQTNPVKKTDMGFSQTLMSKGMTFDQFIENFRSKLYSPEGIAIETFLSTFGAAAIPMTAYAGLTAWDVYQSYIGKEISWGNIFFDLLGLISAGAISGVLSKYIGQVKNLKSLNDVINFFKKTPIFGTIVKWIMALGRGLATLLQWLVKGVQWVANKLGLTAILKVLGKISNFIETSVTKLVTLVGGGQKLAKATGTSAKSYVAASAITGAVGAGTSAPSKPNIPTIDTNYKPTKAELDAVKNIQW